MGSNIELWPKTRVGKHIIIVASTSDQKRQGLQFVTNLPENRLLLFPNMPSGNYFHTVNCLFAMDIIPLNHQNQILDIWTVGTNMKLVGPTPKQTSAVIEAPAGWAKKQRLKIGDNLWEAL